jgi:PHD/YefM family antitoxin component YafN of YafNO toxin-antitoxin module
MAQQTKNTFTILTTNITKQQLNKPMIQLKTKHKSVLIKENNNTM